MHQLSTLADDQLNDHMRQTVALSLTEVERGGIPFSALVVRPGTGVIGSGGGNGLRAVGAIAALVL